MSERDWLLFVKDIHKSITRILEYTNTTKSEFFNDRKTFDAVMRNLEIIGEAVKHYYNSLLPHSNMQFENRNKRLFVILSRSPE
ncbi:hypothetical protein LCGC14_2978610 [marine sediment metagenome]|uniref:Four helix bundle protein n=1 Tax=marine sediment metagenome TaxID=412755 RepID=A0A0F8ZEU6_9ZZZZ